MPAQPVRVTLPVGGTRVHRFQAVREHREDGTTEDWVVVAFPPEGLELATLDFDWHRTVPLAALEDGTIEPLTAGGVPVWGY